jgi:hypothetical protein
LGENFSEIIPNQRLPKSGAVIAEAASAHVTEATAVKAVGPEARARAPRGSHKDEGAHLGEP